jgi:hypothetical protein
LAIRRDGDLAPQRSHRRLGAPVICRRNNCAPLLTRLKARDAKMICAYAYVIVATFVPPALLIASIVIREAATSCRHGHCGAGCRRCAAGAPSDSLGVGVRVVLA